MCKKLLDNFLLTKTMFCSVSLCLSTVVKKCDMMDISCAQKVLRVIFFFFSSFVNSCIYFYNVVNFCHVFFVCFVYSEFFPPFLYHSAVASSILIDQMNWLHSLHMKL